MVPPQWDVVDIEKNVMVAVFDDPAHDDLHTSTSVNIACHITRPADVGGCSDGLFTFLRVTPLLEVIFEP
jgi:hypothetical protein